MPVRLRIGEVAKQQNLTIKALAERAGVAYNTAHSLATSRATRIDLDTLDRICTALSVAPGDLFIWQAAHEASEAVRERSVTYEADPSWTKGTDH